MHVRIATRKSALALWQAEHVAARLERFDDVDRVELVPLSTRGDEILDRSLQKIGGKGLFIKELEIALERGAADIAVHSMKDVPADMPAGFAIGAVLERADHADALVGPDRVTLDTLAEGAVIGSSSLRRQAQLRMRRPDIVVKPLRGNVNTRLAKLDDGEYDAIVLAAAGLERLGLGDRVSQRFAPDEMLPAAAQGVIGIERRADDRALDELLRRLDHAPTAQTTAAERAIAARLGASCQSPVATLASIDGRTLTVTALVALPDGSVYVKDRVTGDAGRAAAVGTELAERLLAAGAADILARCEAGDD